MEVLSTVTPVVLLLLIGYLCRKWKILSSQGVADIKSLISNIFLPVTLVNALGNANYGAGTFATVAVVFVLEVVAMGLGFAARKLVHADSRAMLPVVTTTTEAGQLGYPLYIILCGNAALGNIATLDIANTLFVFGIWCAIIAQADRGDRFALKDMLNMAKKNPCLWAVAIGVFLGVTGLLPLFEACPLGRVYAEAQAMIVSPLGAMILIILGYDLQFQKKLMVEAGKMIAIRFVIMGAVLFAVWMIFGRQADRDMQTALLLFFMLPVSFSAQVYAKKEHNRLLLSTVASGYSIISIIVFAILSAIR